MRWTFHCSRSLRRGTLLLGAGAAKRGAPAPSEPPAPNELTATSPRTENGTTADTMVADRYVYRAEHSRHSLAYLEPEGVFPAEILVPSSATRLVATLTWSGAATDLDAVLIAPGHCEAGLVAELTCSLTSDIQASEPGTGYRDHGGSPAAPDSPSVLVLGQEDLARHCESAACSWNAYVHVNSAVQATLM